MSFPGPPEHPDDLRLYLNGNPFQCDWRVCWIQQAKHDGWLQTRDSYQPECVNHPDASWEDVNLDCDVMDELEKASETKSALDEITQSFLEIFIQK